MSRRSTATPANPHGSRTGARRSGARPRASVGLPNGVVVDPAALHADLLKASGLTSATIRRLRPHFGSATYADPRTGQVYNARLVPIGGVCADGYVRIGRRSHRSGSEQYAHRIVWESIHGAIPFGRQIDHKNHQRSDNRASNLQLLTPGQNVRRAAQRRRKNGEAWTGAKLTDDLVVQIRATAKTRTCADWASELGLDASTVGGARRGRTWRHVKPCPRLKITRRPRAKG